MKKVISKIQTGIRWLLTLECGHTADAIHPDESVFCIQCSKREVQS